MKLKVSDVKKQLKEYDQKELIQLISELYKNSKEVQSYLDVRLRGNDAVDELFTQTQKKVKDEFFPDRGHGKLRLNQAKKAISEFKKMTGNEFKTTELMLYYVEQGVEFTNSFGDIDESFYNSMVSMYEKVTSACAREEDYYRALADRLLRVVTDTEEVGWGFPDALAYLYYDMGYSEEEDE